MDSKPDYRLLLEQKIFGQTFCICDKDKQKLTKTKDNYEYCMTCGEAPKKFSCGECNKSYELQDLKEKESEYPHQDFKTGAQVKGMKLEFTCPKNHLCLAAVVWNHEIKGAKN